MADQFEFPPLTKAAQQIATDVMNHVLEGRTYAAGRTQEWIDQICGQTLAQLKESVSPNFKYVVSALIVQRLGAGLHYDSSALWDTTTDGSVTTKFENDTIVCLTTVIGVAL